MISCTHLTTPGNRLEAGQGHQGRRYSVHLCGRAGLSDPVQMRVTETDIPYHYSDRNLTITAVMRLRLQKWYKPDRFTFEKLKEEYGIYAVRGPRGIPHSLSER